MFPMKAYCWISFVEGVIKGRIRINTMRFSHHFYLPREENGVGI